MLECWQNIQTCRHKYVVISARGRAGTWPKQPISLSAKEPNKRRYGDRRTDKAGGWGREVGREGTSTALSCSYSHSLHRSPSDHTGHLRGHFTVTLRLGSERNKDVNLRAAKMNIWWDQQAQQCFW